MTADLTILSNLGELEKVRQMLRLLLAPHLDSLQQNRIIVAVDEALANIIEHGYQESESEPIRIYGHCDQNQIVVEIEDQACLFDPTQHPAPNLCQQAIQGKKRGLGIFLFTKIMDVQYSRQQNTNFLRLSKAFHSL